METKCRVFEASPGRLHPQNWLGFLVPGFLAIVVAISSTTGVGIGDSWFDEQRILATAALIVVALGCLATWCSSSRDVDYGTPLLLVALILGLVSACLAQRPFVALVEWSTVVLAVWTIVSARVGGFKGLQFSAAAVVVVVSVAYQAGVVANYVSAVLLGFPVGDETFLVGFSNARFPAHLQLLTMPLFPLALAVIPRGSWRIALSLAFALWWTCLIGSGSRTAWVALLCTVLFSALLNPSGRRYARIQCWGALSGFALYAVFFRLIPLVFDFPVELDLARLASKSSLVSRVMLWRTELDAIVESPLVGVGPMHFAYVYNGIAAHPHNLWLQFASEWGSVAAVSFAIVTLGALFKAARLLRHKEEQPYPALGVGLTSSFVAWLVGTQLDGLTVVPTSLVLSTAVLALFVSWLNLLAPPVHVRSAVRFAVGLGWVASVLVAASILITLPFSPFGEPRQREQDWRKRFPTELLLPRYWQQGWIGPDKDPTAGTSKDIK